LLIKNNVHLSSGMSFEINEIKSIDTLDLLANKIVEGFLIGLHRSPFHGFSAEFREHRQYNVGDPIKSIDQKVFARTDKMYIKKFDEETNLKCQLVLDVSESMYYPKNQQKSKIEFSIIAIASLIRLLQKQRDAFGLTTFADKIHENIPPKLSEINKQHIYAILNEHLKTSPFLKESNIALAMNQLALSLKKRSLVVIFSDLLETIESDVEERSNAFVKSMQHLTFQKHEVIVFSVLNKKVEIEFEFENRPMEFVDVESGEKIKLHANTFQEEYKKIAQEKLHQLKQKCIQLNVQFVDVDIEDDYTQILQSFLIKRKKMQ